MNGIEKRELQKAQGVFPHVDAMDKLRLRFGFDRVRVLTPKVETRLRSGECAQIPLKIEVMEPTQETSIVCTLLPNYPNETLVVEVFQGGGDETKEKDEILSSEVQAFCDELPLPICIMVVVDFFHSLLPSPKEETKGREGDEIGSEEGEEYEDQAEVGVEEERSEEQAAATDCGDEERKDVDVRGACKRCRSIIFNGGVSYHKPGAKDFARRGGARNACTSLFLADTETLCISLPIGENEGKIVCTKCQSRLGLWNWAGSQCSCGVWVTPAICITRSKIDEIFL